MKKGGGSESTIIVGPSKSVLVCALHSLEYVLRFARFRVFMPKLLLLHGLHYSTNIYDIKEDLSLLGHELLYIRNMYHPVFRNQMSLFSIELKINDSNSNNFNINCILHCKMSVE